MVLLFYILRKLVFLGPEIRQKRRHGTILGIIDGRTILVTGEPGAGGQFIPRIVVPVLDVHPLPVLTLVKTLRTLLEILLIESKHLQTVSRALSPLLLLESILQRGLRVQEEGVLAEILEKVDHFPQQLGLRLGSHHPLTEFKQERGMVLRDRGTRFIEGCPYTVQQFILFRSEFSFLVEMDDQILDEVIVDLGLMLFDYLLT